MTLHEKLYLPSRNINELEKKRLVERGFACVHRIEALLKSVDAKIAATQQAVQRENEIRTAEAEAKKAEAIALGEANSRLIVAKAEADAIRVKGEALRQNPNLVELVIAEKWNGVTPLVVGAGGQLLNLDVAKMQGR